MRKRTDDKEQKKNGRNRKTPGRGAGSLSI